MSPARRQLQRRAIDTSQAFTSLWSAAPSSVRPILQLDPSKAFAIISSDFLDGTPTWFTVLPTEVQSYYINEKSWRVDAGAAGGVATPDTPLIGNTAATTLTTESDITFGPNQVVTNPGIPAGSLSTVRQLPSFLRPTTAGLATHHVLTTQTMISTSLKNGSPTTITITTVGPASSVFTSGASSFTSAVMSGTPEVQSGHSSREPATGIAIGTSLGGAIFAAVVLLTLIAIFKQRRRIRDRRASSSYVEQAPKMASTTPRHSDTYHGTNTIRAVEIGGTPRTSWFKRESSLPEVVHELEADSPPPMIMARSPSPSRFRTWSRATRPLSNHF